jgi:hypothetical protein
VASPDFSSGHAIDANQRCVACHPGWDAPSIATTSHGEFSSDPTVAAKQSQLCLQCHAKAMPDAVHGSPHDLAGPALRQMTERQQQEPAKTFPAAWRNRQPMSWEKQTTECSQCHREHQGKMHSLQTMASDKCQSCHRNQFESFSHGHPEFRSYPKTTERNIAFDHTRHRDLHFIKKNSEFQCSQCHVHGEQIGAVGQVFRSVSFETACASCHAQPLKSSLQDGLLVLQLPSVDKKTLASLGADIGRWPESASQLNDGNLPVVMQLLLASEPLGVDLLTKLPSSGRLSEIDLQQPEQRDAIVTLTQTTKYLFKKLANAGQPGFKASVQQFVNSRATASGIEPRLDEEWLSGFASGIPPDLFRAAYVEWFSEPRDRAMDTKQSRIKGPPARVQLSSRIRQPDDDLLKGTSDLLASPSDDSLIAGPDSLLDHKPAAENGNQTGENASVGNSFQDPRTWDQLIDGGWMIDRQRMAVVYVPSGHADPWLARWIELARWQLDSPNSPGASNVALQAFGQQCTSCHLLNTSSVASGHTEPTRRSWLVSFREANALPVASSDAIKYVSSKYGWRAMTRPFNQTPITRFDHTPHLALPATRDCNACHRLGEPKSDQLGQAIEYGPGRPEFMSISRSQCASCHQAGGAGESCTQCHNYHVGEKSWR